MEQDNKNHDVRVRLSKEELQKIQSKAKELGHTPSGFLRMLGLRAELKVSYD